MIVTYGGAFRSVCGTVLALALMFALTACGEQNQEPGATATADAGEGVPGSDPERRDDAGAGPGKSVDACALLPKADLNRIMGVTYQDGDGESV